ncbi:head-tail connector protein [Mycobacterium phage BigNuz]|uniref:Head-to-tail connector protein n=2 Tax=Bignuzvirus bignuz TaxID=1983736 RepID=G1JX22_9CAUD|nr:head-tail connector protein [Mycobacterium phage BigNuz]AEL98170.1 hypothetical protein PBI_BIGNUZ_7 [Mycobacterium phage BigNuz]AOT24846.1 hypothetical protein PBI_NAZO_7 [Mycobacterium phage Nazo]
MRYRVLAALVCARDQGGRTHHRYYGEIIEWLPADQAKHLLELGMVEKLGAAAEPATDDDDLAEADDEPQPRAEGGAPLRAAPKADWVEYAVSKGVDRDEAEALNKSELVELYG